MSCAITGFYKSPGTQFPPNFVRCFGNLFRASSVRGRDGFGYATFGPASRLYRVVPKVRNEDMEAVFEKHQEVFDWNVHNADVFLGNHRAEPTTEYIADKLPSDQQPYTWWHTTIVHNGTIANDRDLREIHEWSLPTRIDSAVIAPMIHTFGKEAYTKLKGSMAIASYVDDRRELQLYRNYQPIYLLYNANTDMWVFSSLRNALDHFPKNGWEPREFPPYSTFSISGYRIKLERDVAPEESRAIVICSGGLDSVTAATVACRDCSCVTILHFMYGCRAEQKEKRAIRNTVERLKVLYPDCNIQSLFMDMQWLGELGGSTLTDPSLGKITVGDVGAEFAHEWVPARNTAMIGVAASLADRIVAQRIYLGLNLEESGAYPDNTIEFFEEFNRVLAVGTQARPRIINPLENMMKHEIVKLALDIGAPIQHAWSCYHGGKIHCGECGPCRMRKIAFQMNGKTDSITYAV